MLLRDPFSHQGKTPGIAEEEWEQRHHITKKNTVQLVPRTHAAVSLSATRVHKRRCKHSGVGQLSIPLTLGCAHI